MQVELMQHCRDISSRDGLRAVDLGVPARVFGSGRLIANLLDHDQNAAVVMVSGEFDGTRKTLIGSRHEFAAVQAVLMRHNAVEFNTEEGISFAVCEGNLNPDTEAEIRLELANPDPFTKFLQGLNFA